jgi:hypothetical protein
MGVVQPTVECATVAQFLDALSPLGVYFGEDPIDAPWLFRGQGHDYPLIPSALRGDGRLARLTGRDTSTLEERRLAERDVLASFFEIADRRGLVLPDDSQQLRSLLELQRSERGDWYEAQGGYPNQTPLLALSLSALAQHYGVPTCLLDWTRRPLVAAYFAAEDALRRADWDEELASMVVWAFYFPLLGKQDQEHSPLDPVSIVTAPSASNPNLRTQQGVFTLLAPFRAKEGTRPYPPLDQALEEVAVSTDPSDEATRNLAATCRLRRFALPARNALEVLRCLAKLDVTPTSVYPGYHTVITDMELRARWSKGAES